jgi:hypothetical protein
MQKRRNARIAPLRRAPARALAQDLQELLLPKPDRTQSSAQPGTQSNAQSKRASTGAREAKGPFTFDTRRANGSPRRNAQVVGNRFGWVVVGAMLLLLFWRFSPSTRTPIEHMLGDSQRYEGTVDNPQPRRWLDPRVARATGVAPDAPSGAIEPHKALSGSIQQGTIQRLLPGIDVQSGNGARNYDSGTGQPADSDAAQ